MVKALELEKEATQKQKGREQGEQRVCVRVEGLDEDHSLFACGQPCSSLWVASQPSTASS